MEKEFKERRVVRRLMNKLSKDIESKIDGKIDSFIIMSDQDQLIEHKNRLEEIDKKIINSMMENPEFDEDSLEKEEQEIQDFKSKWRTINARCVKYLKDGNDNTAKKHNLKLPKIEQKKFDGDIKNWLVFWNQFRKIDEDDSIICDDKYHYLQQAMVKDTDVCALVESYPSSSYRECLDHLKSRYGREELLIQLYVRELLSLILLKAEGDKLSLTRLYDKLSAQLRALESLGVTKDKYAAFILPMVESALPAEILKAWERSSKHSIKMDDELNKLLEFLKKEVDCDQRISVAKNSFIAVKAQEDTIHEPTASCLVSNIKATGGKPKVYSCIWCEKDTHSSLECYKINKMSIEQRRDHLRKKRACTLCLKVGHYSKICKAFIKCLICMKRHSTVLCTGSRETKEKTQNNDLNDSRRDPPSTSLQSCTNSLTLLQTMIINLMYGTRRIQVRVLLDSGSQRSYVRKDIMDKLKIPSVSTEMLTHCLFGGLETKSVEHDVYNLTIEGLDSIFKINLLALSQNCICSNVPKVNMSDIKLVNWLKQHQIILTDKGDTSEVDLLIGADYLGFLLTGTIIQLENGLVAIKTKLGWTLQGKQEGVTTNNLSTSLFCANNLDIAGFWSLETLGIRDPVEVKSKEENEAEVMMHFEETVEVNNAGRYEVQLPWKVGHNDLLSNYNLSKQRLISTTKKLISSGTFDSYHKILNEWCKEGIIELVTEPELEENNSHYLPHRAVLKDASLTTKIRPVFDASARDKNGKSLNLCLEKGINFLEKIPSFLVSFRKGAIGITSDIAKAFLQISISPKDRDQLRFLWWEDNSHAKMVTYRHCRVVFGLTSSPFLLSATIQHHLQNNRTSKLANTAKLLSKSFYVDNCVTSLDSADEVHKFIAESKEIMNNAKFDLRQWVASPLQINETEQSVISVLGLIWHIESDELYCNTINLPTCQSVQHATKRDVLSLTQRVFDPIGFTSPIMLPPKQILQEAWNRGLSWDEEMPQDLLAEFREWYKYLSYLNKCKIPRRFSADIIKDCQVSLHLFCDASKNGYGACVYLRTEKVGKVTVQLVSAKARITSPKKVTIPRLELIAALIGSRLICQARENLELLNCLEYCWTDSGVVLCWIKRELPWNTFVGNRVKEIRQNTNIKNWHHIPGLQNWADLASRGCNAKILLDCRWWEGPDWLRLTSEEWPQSELTVDDDIVHLELKKIVCNTNIIINGNILNQIQSYFSKYSKIVRTIAWLQRFINNVRNRNSKNKGEITYKEYDQAEKTIIKIIQSENKELMQKSCGKLTQFHDEDNIIRIKTKLLLSDFPENVKTPYLLYSKHPTVIKMVKQRHTQLQHAGIDQLITDIRSKFWIVGIRRLVKSVISCCVICKRYKTKPLQAPTAPLPLERVTCDAPFLTTGVDLAGPLYLRGGEKSWIVLYTCAVYRAVHLELTRSLSTEAFMMTLRRFIARRGRANMFMSDQGTNFIGTKNLLNNLNWDEIQQMSTIRCIQWKVNVPSAAWWGGYWERLIRIMKDLLRRVLGKSSVTYDELHTILCDCEATMNGRPLTYVQDDQALSLEPLTPAHFIQPIPSTDVTDLDQIEGKLLKSRFRYLQQLRKEFRERFKAEYLTLLVQKGKEIRDDLKVGDVVIIQTEDKRIKWPLGIVEEIYTGKDGENRAANVRTHSGRRVRPFQRLFKLELSSSDDIVMNKKLSSEFNRSTNIATEAEPATNSSFTKDSQQSGDSRPQVSYTTRSGRKVKLPSKYELYA